MEVRTDTWTELGREKISNTLVRPLVHFYDRRTNDPKSRIAKLFSIEKMCIFQTKIREYKEKRPKRRNAKR